MSDLIMYESEKAFRSYRDYYGPIDDFIEDILFPALIKRQELSSNDVVEILKTTRQLTKLKAFL